MALRRKPKPTGGKPKEILPSEKTIDRELAKAQEEFAEAKKNLVKWQKYKNKSTKS